MVGHSLALILSFISGSLGVRPDSVDGDNVALGSPVHSMGHGPGRSGRGGGGRGKPETRCYNAQCKEMCCDDWRCDTMCGRQECLSDFGGNWQNSHTCNMVLAQARERELETASCATLKRMLGAVKAIQFKYRRLFETCDGDETEKGEVKAWYCEQLTEEQSKKYRDQGENQRWSAFCGSNPQFKEAYCRRERRLAQYTSYDDGTPIPPMKWDEHCSGVDGYQESYCQNQVLHHFGAGARTGRMISDLANGRESEHRASCDMQCKNFKVYQDAFCGQWFLRDDAKESCECPAK